ncbi:hypothetical protein LDFHOB_04230 [Candidatus Electronema aureum]
MIKEVNGLLVSAGAEAAGAGCGVAQRLGLENFCWNRTHLVAKKRGLADRQAPFFRSGQSAPTVTLSRGSTLRGQPDRHHRGNMHTVRLGTLRHDSRRTAQPDRHRRGSKRREQRCTKTRA